MHLPLLYQGAKLQMANTVLTAWSPTHGQGMHRLRRKYVHEMVHCARFAKMIHFRWPGSCTAGIGAVFGLLACEREMRSTCTAL